MNNINIANQRLRELINLLKNLGVVGTDTDFANKVGKHRNYLSDVVVGKRSLTSKFVVQICEAFPDVNAEWLLTGEGQMLKDNSQNIINSTAGRDIVQTHNAGDLELIETLKQQIKEKDEQIKAKDEQIKALLNFLNK